MNLIYRLFKEPPWPSLTTSGFGTTTGVKLGDTTTPPKALARALTDVQQFEGALKQCVTVPLPEPARDADAACALCRRRNPCRQLPDLSRKRRATEGVSGVGQRDGVCQTLKCCWTTTCANAGSSKSYSSSMIYAVRLW